ncbi:MAG: DUF177 domain-containing protein [Gemmatimonadota bacterium]
MLRVDVRQLKGGSVSTDGQLAPTDSAFDGLDVALDGPVDVEGTLHPTAEGNFLWRGRIRATVAGECRRCLTPVTQQVDEAVEVLFSADPEFEDDPSVYPLPAHADVIDVAAAIREELALRVSAFPLCRPDCKGFCAVCGADLNAGPCSCMAAGSTN